MPTARSAIRPIRHTGVDRPALRPLQSALRQKLKEQVELRSPDRIGRQRLGGGVRNVGEAIRPVAPMAEASADETSGVEGFEARVIQKPFAAIGDEHVEGRAIRLPGLSRKRP